jgi:hypothetical protein
MPRRATAASAVTFNIDFFDLAGYMCRPRAALVRTHYWTGVGHVIGSTGKSLEPLKK